MTKSHNGMAHPEITQLFAEDTGQNLAEVCTDGSVQDGQKKRNFR